MAQTTYLALKRINVRDHDDVLRCINVSFVMLKKTVIIY